MPRVKGYKHKPSATRRSKKGSPYKPVGLDKSGWTIGTFRKFKKALK